MGTQVLLPQGHVSGQRVRDGQRSTPVEDNVALIAVN